MKAWLLVFLLAGCASGPTESPSDLVFEPMDVETTASEPFEYRGFIRVLWGDGTFAIDSETESDLARGTVRHGSDAYTTDAFMGWTHTEPARLSPRIHLWDLRLLIENAPPATGPERVYEGELPQGTYRLELDLDGPRIKEARLVAPAARESPFVFTPGAEPRFEPVVPEALPRSEVLAGNKVARDGHAFLIGLIQERAQTPGRGLPDEVDAQSMQVELLRSGRQWPTNPYDGAPVADRFESGHFEWSRCGPQDARYTGYGWDGTLLSEVWGRGCDHPRPANLISQ